MFDSQTRFQKVPMAEIHAGQLLTAIPNLASCGVRICVPAWYTSRAYLKSCVVFSQDIDIFDEDDNVVPLTEKHYADLFQSIDGEHAKDFLALFAMKTIDMNETIDILSYLFARWRKHTMLRKEDIHFVWTPDRHMIMESVIDLGVGIPVLYNVMIKVSAHDMDLARGLTVGTFDDVFSYIQANGILLDLRFSKLFPDSQVDVTDETEGAISE